MGDFNGGLLPKLELIDVPDVLSDVLDVLNPLDPRIGEFLVGEDRVGEVGVSRPLHLRAARCMSGSESNPSSESRVVVVSKIHNYIHRKYLSVVKTPGCDCI